VHRDVCNKGIAIFSDLYVFVSEKELEKELTRLHQVVFRNSLSNMRNQEGSKLKTVAYLGFLKLW